MAILAYGLAGGGRGEGGGAMVEIVGAALLTIVLGVAVAALVQVRSARAQLVELHAIVNSRLDELVVAVKATALAEGKEIGAADERRDAREARDWATAEAEKIRRRAPGG